MHLRTFVLISRRVIDSDSVRPFPYFQPGVLPSMMISMLVGSGWEALGILTGAGIEVGMGVGIVEVALLSRLSIAERGDGKFKVGFSIYSDGVGIVLSSQVSRFLNPCLKPSMVSWSSCVCVSKLQKFSNSLIKEPRRTGSLSLWALMALIFWLAWLVVADCCHPACPHILGAKSRLASWACTFSHHSLRCVDLHVKLALSQPEKQQNVSVSTQFVNALA